MTDKAWSCRCYIGVGTDPSDHYDGCPIVAELTRLTEVNSAVTSILDELADSFDQQTYSEVAREDFDAPDDREYSVNITAKQLRAITTAVNKATVVENNRLPMSAEGRKYFELGKTMLGLLVPETMFSRPAGTTMRYEPIPYGRAWGWCCYDANRYDGPESAIGSGATKEEAYADYEDQLEAERMRQAIERRKTIPIVTDQFEPTDYRPAPDNYHEIEEEQ